MGKGGYKWFDTFLAKLLIFPIEILPICVCPTDVPTHIYIHTIGGDRVNLFIFHF